MDFVVVGLGVGSLAILLGLALREAGARWWSLPADQALPEADIERRLMIGRAGRAGGLVVCLAGGAIIVLTGLALGLGLSDRAGAIVVMATITVAVLGGVGWGLVYAQRHHPRPVSRAARRRRAGGGLPEAAPMAVPSLAATIDAAGMVDPGDDDGPDLADALVMGEDEEAVADEVALAGSDPEPAAGPVPAPPEPVLGPPLPVSEVEAAAAEPPPDTSAAHERAAGEPDATNAGDQPEAVPAPDAAGAPPSTGPDDRSTGPDDPAITPLAEPEAGPRGDPGYAASGQERRR